MAWGAFDRAVAEDLGCTVARKDEDIILLLSSLESEDQIEDVFMVMFRNMNDDLLPLLWALWNGNREKYPALSWPMISSDIFKTRLANLLGQWLRIKGADRESLLPIKRYVAQQRNSPDMKVRFAAISYTVCPDTCDLRFLVDEVLREDGSFSVSAFDGIIRILGPHDRNVLREIRNKIKSKEILDAVDRHIEFYSGDEFRETRDFLESADCEG